MKYRRSFNFCLAAIVLVCSAAFANGVDDAVVKSAIREAWLKYEKGDYEGAREVVDKFNGESNLYLKLISSVLYEKEGKCSEALKAAEDVEWYYDSNREALGDISKGEENEVLNVYLGFKKIGIKCNSEMLNWAEFVEDAAVYLELSDDPNKNKVLPVLGYAHKQITIENIELAILHFSKMASEASNQVYRESAHFHLANLYFMAGQIEKSIGIAEGLLKMAKNKDGWIAEMKKLPGLNDQVLGSERIKELLKKEMALQ